MGEAGTGVWVMEKYKVYLFGKIILLDLRMFGSHLVLRTHRASHPPNTKVETFHATIRLHHHTPARHNGAGC
jgi:hypothetical protein